MRANRSLLLVVFLLFSAATGCAASQRKSELKAKYGEEHVRDRVVTEEKAGEVDYWTEVLPDLESRCVVCHGCYDAPCQLKLWFARGPGPWWQQGEGVCGEPATRCKLDPSF